MTFRFILPSLTAALLASASFAPQAHACACCSEPGQRIELTQEMDSYSRDELSSVRLAPQSRLYSDAGFPDTVSGIADPLMEPYTASLIRRPSEWTFEFVDAKGRKGSILFPLPKRFTRFEVDPHGIAVPASGNGPSLYKEWRLHGLAKLGGILAANGTWAHARFILHGEGNSCTSAPDFTSWTLSVTGKDIRFRFLGTTVR